MQLIDFLSHASHQGASDLFLSAGACPMIRVDGALHKITEEPQSHDALLVMLHGIMTKEQQHLHETQRDTDFSINIAPLGRFRVNVFYHARGAGAVFRPIPSSIPPLQELGLPPIINSFLSYSQGLVLITGPAGSGKSTTLASMIQAINQHAPIHIITIEDPIEFLHTNQRALITQREVHRDTLSFHGALRAALRESPDIILVGELRDLETIRLAMTAAETGHLVLGTLHTQSATQTIHRLIDVFPSTEKPLACSMLSASLQAVVSQRLIKNIEKGRTLALEIMVATPAIRHLIKENNITHMYSALQTGQSCGMQTLDQHLVQLVNHGQISKETAKVAAVNKLLF